jgi:hypothetical protein
MTAVILQFAPLSTNCPAHDGHSPVEPQIGVTGLKSVTSGGRLGPLRTLAVAPCRNDAEFIEKLRLLLEIERELWGVDPGEADMFGATLMAADSYLNPKMCG